MNKIKKNVVVYLFFVCALVLVAVPVIHAQEGVLDIGIKSPTAASLGKFGEIPVSKYTGIPDISIPLYEVRNRDIGFNIMLRYHASGNKVDEIPGWVGLGWALQTGGVITRTKRDFPDEEIYGFKNKAAVLETAIRQLGDASVFYNTLGQTTPYYIDTEPDLFTYNFGSYTGQFLFDKNGEVVTIPTTDLKIYPNNDQLSSWTIITENGTRYIFAAKEESTNAIGEPNEISYTSSWYLTKIESANGDNVINIDYDGPGVSFLDSRPYSEEILETSCQVVNAMPTHIRNSNSTAAVSVNKITYSDEEIQFYPTAGRLDSIVVSRNGLTRKVIKFTYGHFNGSDQRLKLIAVKVKNGNIEDRPYLFTYNESITMPPRLSKRQDHWGFYNQSSIYNYSFPEAYDPDLEISLQGNDKDPNEAGSKAYILTKIKYPTGGYTEFEYEAHDYGYIGGGEESYGFVKQREELSVIKAERNQRRYDEKSFQINGLSAVPVAIQASFSDDGQVEPPSFEGPSYVQLFDSNNQLLYKAENNNSTGSTEIPPEEVMNLSPGTYRLVVSSDHGSGAKIVVNWNDMVTVKTKMAGGVRIKKISSYPDASSEPIIREYKYLLSTDTDRSSGVLVNKPSYIFSVVAPVQSSIYYDYNCSFTIRASSLQAPLGVTRGSHIGYSEVWEIFGENGEHGMNKYFYRSPLNYPDHTSSSFPNHVSYDWRRGQLLKLEKYDGNANLVYKKENEYAYFGFGQGLLMAPNKIPSLRRRTISIVSYYPDPPKFAQIYQPAIIRTGWTYKKKKTETYYDGNSTLSYNTELFYEYADNQLLTMQVETNSGGAQRTMEYEYAHERYGGMEAAHMLSQPHKVTTRDGAGDVLKIDWTLWDTFDTTGDGSPDQWQPCARWVGGPGLGTAAPSECN